MDQILIAMLQSEKPAALKEQVVRKVLSLGRQPQSSADTFSMLDACIKCIISSRDGFAVESCKAVFECWAQNQTNILPQFFTPATLSNLFEADAYNPADLIWIMHKAFSLLEDSDQFFDLCRIVERRAIQFVRAYPDFHTIVSFCQFLSSFRYCIPQGIYTATFCIDIINAVSTFTLPRDGVTSLQTYVQGVSQIIGGLLQHIWSSVDDNSIIRCLEAIFVLISKDVDRDPSFALGGIVQYIPTKFVSSVTEATVARDRISEACIFSALSRMIDWLAWPAARNVHLWIVAFLHSLAKANKFSILIDITHEKILSVYDKLQYPVVQDGAFAVLSHMLLSFQHSPLPFHKIVGMVPATVRQLEQQQLNPNLVTKFSDLMHCLIQLHPGYPDLYEPVLEAINHIPAPSHAEIQRFLAQKKWQPLQGSFSHLPLILPKSDTGKTGLVNLGNTCYMNSVVQALYMCDGLRRDVLSSPVDRGQSVLSRLQETFAFLSFSQRAAISPASFLEATRPPWFTPGCQQDCSEYLRYILDQLHEQEMAIRRRGQVEDKHPTQVQKFFGGRVVNTYTCSVCHFQSSHVESFNDLPLAFPEDAPPKDKSMLKLSGGNGSHAASATHSSNAASSHKLRLDDLLAYYLQAEKLEGANQYHCNQCNRLQDAERTLKIIQSPKHLILTLLRFSYSTKTQSRSKICTDVKYPRTIYLPVCAQTDSKTSPKHGGASGDNSERLEVYCLNGVIVHSGLSSESGHYYCYARPCKVDRDRNEASGKKAKFEDEDYLQDRWYLFNDSRVSYSNYESFSTVTSKFARDTAYVLIYGKLNLDGSPSEVTKDGPLQPHLMRAVEKDNLIYVQEQEAAREREARRRQASSTNFHRHWNDHNGPPGSCGGGGFGSMPRFVC